LTVLVAGFYELYVSGTSTMFSKIKLENATLGYLTETVIQGLSLEISKGDLIGVFGPNGAGKTTLLCGINGLAVQSGGQVFIDDMELTRWSGVGIRKRIGYVPQHFEVDPGVPVLAREVVLMGRYGRMGVLRFPGRGERKLLEELIDLFEIGHIIHKPFGQLSGGEKKKVLIARALAKEPEIMLLDEIFAWLDQKMETKLIEIIKEIHREKDLTTLIVSHNFKMIERVCKSVIWMEKGEVKFAGDKEEFFRRVGT